MDTELRVASRGVGKIRDELRRVAEEDAYLEEYLLSQPQEKNGVDNGHENGALSVTNGQSRAQASADSDEEEWIGLD